jgi:DNA mismatch repair ATPase MutS
MRWSKSATWRRLISRISVGRTNARDLKQLQLSLAQIPRSQDADLTAINDADRDQKSG